MFLHTASYENTSLLISINDIDKVFDKVCKSFCFDIDVIVNSLFRFIPVFMHDVRHCSLLRHNGICQTWAGNSC